MQQGGYMFPCASFNGKVLQFHFENEHNPATEVRDLHEALKKKFTLVNDFGEQGELESGKIYVGNLEVAITDGSAYSGSGPIIRGRGLQFYLYVAL